MEKLPENKVEPEHVQESFTLKHNGKLYEVGREELIALAQKGMDYDRIRNDRDECRQRLAKIEMTDQGMNDGNDVSDDTISNVAEVSGEKMMDMSNEGFVRLLTMYPEVQRYDNFEALPEGFVAGLIQGRSPVEAWQMYLLDRQKLKMAMLERNNRNKSSAAPNVRSSGRYEEDGFVKALFGR